MGNCASQTLTFHEEFLSLIDRVKVSGDFYTQRKLLLKFVNTYQMSIDEVLNEYQKLKMPQRMPLRLIKSHLIIETLKFMDSNKYKKIILDQCLNLFSDASQVLDTLYLSSKPLDMDICLMLSGDLIEVYSKNTRNRASYMLLYLLRQGKEQGSDAIKYIKVSKNPILIRVTENIRQILTQLSIEIDLRTIRHILCLT